MTRRWNPRSLLEGLMALLQSPKLKIRKGKLRKEHGKSLYERDPRTNEVLNMEVVIDPRNAPVVTIVIHELLHLHLAIFDQIDLKFSDSLEEAMVKALTDELEGYMNNPKNEKLLAQWIKAVDQRLS